MTTKRLSFLATVRPTHGTPRCHAEHLQEAEGRSAAGRSTFVGTGLCWAPHPPLPSPFLCLVVKCQSGHVARVVFSYTIVCVFLCVTTTHERDLTGTQAEPSTAAATETGRTHISSVGACPTQLVNRLPPPSLSRLATKHSSSTHTHTCVSPSEVLSNHARTLRTFV